MLTSMKSDWRNRLALIVMPSGSAAWMSANTVSICRVRASVLAPGCFWMPMTTAGSPLKLAVPRLGAGPIWTSAISPTSTGRSPRWTTKMRAMSAASCTRPRPWIRNS